ncbi:sensor histidine kinase [Laedolimicola ammoniilytica]|uniref:histidine kinase n=1 Tax=Laedolimicola ammoniilytica TaxID=2981771 RepID=A0ABT2RZT2_9FIRM|nr:ATP-binding protein [Laedolimicola ammoniilytica]MCU6697783.1 ATP-binding protein [Laedolimicola ammoniilytica]SCH06026.1 Alkaline phosphatase synthesis sensor protein phoR [uncultured Clostridium sp.]SCI45926.1 Alkaline phosphatase synthesis sensor protein phoR [uncultured Clostridium sp.]
MKKKVLVGYIIAAMIALVAFEYAFWTNGFSYLEHQSEKSYLTQAEMLRDLFQAEDVAGENGYEQFAENYAKTYNIRITIIDSEGNVLGESQGASDLMSNHLNREEVQKALEGESNSLIRKSDTFDVDYCYCAVPVDSGDFHGVMRVALPLSELKNMDNEFVRSTILVTLVLLVVVFFLGAYFRKYVQAMKKVENMRREFVSNVTHELKTPLTSIRGFVETLKDGAIEDPKMAHRFLDIIDIETERLSHLISDTLLLSEIESKQDTNREPCDVNAVIAEVVELLQPKVKEHVRLIFQPDPTLKPYNCNRDRIKQLLINLVDNGLKATEFGAVTVRCRTMGNELVLEISDTGIGMEEEQLERIFERFYRVDKGRSKAQGGTGLGLSIVKHIVELYHGTVHVTSKPGVGTEFTVKLPY